jgi:Fur family ferric uptake transcriptional regulator
MRMTHQREIILNELRKVRTHPTADELYQLVRERLPRISLATVYRNLEQLASAGMVVKLFGTGNQKRFDGDTTRHHHIRCIKCGRIADIRLANEPEAEPEVADACGYKVLEKHFDYLGLCPVCSSEEMERCSGGKQDKKEFQNTKSLC